MLTHVKHSEICITQSTNISDVPEADGLVDMTRLYWLYCVKEEYVTAKANTLTGWVAMPVTRK